MYFIPYDSENLITVIKACNESEKNTVYEKCFDKALNSLKLSYIKNPMNLIHRIFIYIVCLPSRAFIRVILSAYSRSLPIGIPCAIRVTFTSNGARSLEI